MTPTEELLLIYALVWGVAVAVLWFRFYRVWRNEEKRHWKTWGSPGLAGSVLVFHDMIFVKGLTGAHNKRLSGIRRTLRILFPLILLLPLVLILLE